MYFVSGSFLVALSANCTLAELFSKFLNILVIEHLKESFRVFIFSRAICFERLNHMCEWFATETSVYVMRFVLRTSRSNSVSAKHGSVTVLRNWAMQAH